VFKTGSRLVYASFKAMAWSSSSESWKDWSTALEIAVHIHTLSMTRLDENIRTSVSGPLTGVSRRSSALEIAVCWLVERPMSGVRYIAVHLIGNCTYSLLAFFYLHINTEAH
jgi:hypothetical protein